MRGIEKLKDFVRANVWGGCTINEALGCSLNVMTTNVHSSIKETPFERQNGRKPSTELTNFLNLSSKAKSKVISARQNNEGNQDQLVIKAARKLRKAVSKRFRYLFLEKKTNKNEFESAYYATNSSSRDKKHNYDGQKKTQEKSKQTVEVYISESTFRRGENPRGPDSRFTSVTLNRSETPTDAEKLRRESSPILEESMLETTLQSPTQMSPVNERGNGS